MALRIVLTLALLSALPVTSTATVETCSGNPCNVNNFGDLAFELDGTAKYLSTDDEATKARRCCINKCKDDKTADAGSNKKKMRHRWLQKKLQIHNRHGWVRKVRFWYRHRRCRDACYM